MRKLLVNMREIRLIAVCLCSGKTNKGNMGSFCSLEECYAGDLHHPTIIIRRPQLKPLGENHLYLARLTAYAQSRRSGSKRDGEKDEDEGKLTALFDV